MTREQFIELVLRFLLDHDSISGASRIDGEDGVIGVDMNDGTAYFVVIQDI